MLRLSGGRGKSSGMRVSMRNGSTSIEAEVSTVSASALKATQQPQ